MFISAWSLCRRVIVWSLWAAVAVGPNGTEITHETIRRNVSTYRAVAFGVTCLQCCEINSSEVHLFQRWSQVKNSLYNCSFPPSGHTCSQSWAKILHCSICQNKVCLLALSTDVVFLGVFCLFPFGVERLFHGNFSCWDIYIISLHSFCLELPAEFIWS